MRIGSDHNLHTFLKKEIFNFGKTFKRLQAVRSVASGGKFYRLPPDKENTGYYKEEFDADHSKGLKGYLKVHVILIKYPCNSKSQILRMLYLFQSTCRLISH